MFIKLASILSVLVYASLAAHAAALVRKEKSEASPQSAGYTIDITYDIAGNSTRQGPVKILFNVDKPSGQMISRAIPTVSGSLEWVTEIYDATHSGQIYPDDISLSILSDCRDSARVVGGKIDYSANYDDQRWFSCERKSGHATCSSGWKVVAAAKGVSDHGEKLITGEVKSKGFPTRCMRFYWPYLKPGQ